MHFKIYILEKQTQMQKRQDMTLHKWKKERKKERKKDIIFLTNDGLPMYGIFLINFYGLCFVMLYSFIVCLFIAA